MKRATLCSTLFAALCVSPLANADVLNTPNFTITITVKCPEGEVTCNNVSYVGVSKKAAKISVSRVKLCIPKGQAALQGAS